MPEEFIRKYFSKDPFTKKKYPIFKLKCEDKKCKLKGDFNDYIILNGDNIVKCLKNNESSVDCIVFSKKVSGRQIDVLLCELTKGSKKYDKVKKKMRQSGEFIIPILEKAGFIVRNFDCIYLGRYEEEKRLNKSQIFSIPGCSRCDLKIRRFNCGIDISQIDDLNFIIN